LLLPVFGMSTAQTLSHAPLRATLEIAFLGIFPAAIAYMTFAYATVRLPASRVMTFLYLIPPIAMAISWAYLNEIPTWISILGGCLAIGGVAVVNSARKQMEPVVALEEG